MCGLVHMPFSDSKSAKIHPNFQPSQSKECLPSSSTSLQKWRSIYQEAEDLYFQGKFEEALVLYHRGARIRPWGKEFKMGIQKTTKALETQLGLNDGRALFQEENEKKIIENTLQPIKSSPEPQRKYFNTSYHRSKRRHTIAHPESGIRGSLQWPQEIERETQKDGVRHMSRLKNTCQYINMIANEMDPSSEVGRAIRRYAKSTVDFLESHGNFWKLQRPIERPQKIEPVIEDIPTVNEEELEAKKLFKEFNLKYIEIWEAYSSKEYDHCLELAETAVSSVKDLNLEEKITPWINKDFYELLSGIYNIMGMSYFHLEQFDDAIEWHQSDLDLGSMKDILLSKKRSLENLARIYMTLNSVEKAISILKERLSLCDDQDEYQSTIFHEMGYGYLSLKKLEEAKDCGEKGLTFGKKQKNDAVKMNSLILLGQVIALSEDLEGALVKFEGALKIAQKLRDNDIEFKIRTAILNIQKTMNKKKKKERSKARKEKKERKRTHSERLVPSEDGQSAYGDTVVSGRSSCESGFCTATGSAQADTWSMSYEDSLRRVSILEIPETPSEEPINEDVTEKGVARYDNESHLGGNVDSTMVMEETKPDKNDMIVLDGRNTSSGISVVVQNHSKYADQGLLMEKVETGTEHTSQGSEHTKPVVHSTFVPNLDLMETPDAIPNFHHQDLGFGVGDVSDRASLLSLSDAVNKERDAGTPPVGILLQKEKSWMDGYDQEQGNGT